MDLRGLAQKILQTPAKVGQYGADALFGGPQGTGRPIPFPFNRGFIAEKGEAMALPKGSIQRKQAEFNAMTTPVMGLTGAVRSSAPKYSAPKIDPDDMDVMEQVIDYARLKQPFNFKTEQMAGDLMERYPMKMRGAQPKNMTQVADVFQKALERLYKK